MNDSSRENTTSGSTTNSANAPSLGDRDIQNQTDENGSSRLLPWGQRLKIAFLCLGFVIVCSFVSYFILWFGILTDGGRRPFSIGTLMEASRGNVLVMALLLVYSALVLVAVIGMIQALRGRRTWLINWILRDLSKKSGKLTGIFDDGD